MKQIRILFSCFLLAALLAGCGAKGPIETDLQTLMQEIYTVNSPPFSVTEPIPVDLGDSAAVSYYLGLEDGDLLREALFSESMIGAQAYSLVLVRVKDASTVSEVAAAMKSGIDTRKWICVEADDLRVAACGDVIMLAMIDSAYAGDLTAGDLVNAFRQACGRPLDIE